MKRKYNEIDNKSSTIDVNDKCPICMENLENKNLTITKCGHKFCHTCLDTHSCKDNKCPVCRTDMETKMKIKTLCDCDIRESVSTAMYNASDPHLTNLCKRIIKKFLENFSEHELKDEVFQKDQDISDIRKVLVEKFKEDVKFKDDIFKFLFHEIFYFSMINSTEACSELRSVYESLT